MDVVDKIIAFETGEMDANEIIEFFAGLLKAGKTSIITAISGGNNMMTALIDAGYIDESGEILRLAGD